MLASRIKKNNDIELWKNKYFEINSIDN